MDVRRLFDLSGKVALVTGGSRGLGLQMAEALAGMGARVAISARRSDELEEARNRLEALGGEALALTADLARPEAIPGVVEGVLGRWGGIDILVNNAGCNWVAPAEEYPDEGWRKVMALNLDATFFLCREVGRRAMIPRRAGKIINVASIAGLAGNPPEIEMYSIAYNASKGAVVNFTRALAAEWGRYNINVNAIAPGFFPSKMTRATLGRIGAQVLRATPLGRLGGEDDLKGVVVFLASEASRHLSGQILVVDGGAAAA
ncbi:MAG: gluconate 5-dehydrogenase [Betaproteobacteria bacterium CG2_30_68_42]|nr:MAG: gluconate 5-dehydrogenase [Betaproteobacteria bacterium CG2_30_68_42]